MWPYTRQFLLPTLAVTLAVGLFLWTPSLWPAGQQAGQASPAPGDGPTADARSESLRDRGVMRGAASAGALAEPAAAPALSQVGPQANGSQLLGWQVERVEDTKIFSLGGDRSLRLDGADRPHIAYGGKRLY